MSTTPATRAAREITSGRARSRLLAPARLTPIRFSAASGFTLALWIACAAFILLPLGAIVVLALTGSQASILVNSDVLEAGLNSFVSATSSALLAVLAGSALAIFLDRTNLPGRRALWLLALTPMLVPPFVGAIAWLGIAGPASPLNIFWRNTFGEPLWIIYGADGVIALLTVHSYPIAMIIVSAALRRVPSDLEQAARIAGAGAGRSIFAITVPLLKPALLSSFILIAVGNLADFGIPSIIGLPERYTTLATLVYRYLQSGTIQEPLSVVATIGMVLLAIAILALIGDALLSRKTVEMDVSASPAQPIELGRWRTTAMISVWTIVLIVTVLPLVTLLMQSLLKAPGVPLIWENLTLDHLVAALTSTVAIKGTLNSLMLAGLAALICAVIGLGIGVVVTRTRSRSTGALRAIAMAPTAIPGIVIAVAWLVLAPRLGLFNTPWIILCAYVTSFIALVVQSVVAPLSAIPSSAEEAARISGASPLRSLLDISARIAMPATIAGAVMVGVTAVRELTLSVLLLSPGSQTLGVAIFNFQQAGAFSTASALSFVVALVGVAVIGIATRRPR